MSQRLNFEYPLTLVTDGFMNHTLKKILRGMSRVTMSLDRAVCWRFELSDSKLEKYKPRSFHKFADFQISSAGTLIAVGLNYK